METINGIGSIQTDELWWRISPAKGRGHNGCYIKSQYLCIYL